MTAAGKVLRAALDKAQAEQTAAAEQRARLLRSRLPEATALLRTQFGTKRVWLFGSLVQGNPSSDCDVDLAVEGLKPNQYFDALAELMRLFGVRVDLVPVEKAPSSLRDRILAEGAEL